MMQSCQPSHMSQTEFEINVAVADYDLDATLLSGQAFGWERNVAGWRGVVAGKWVEVRGEVTGLRARTVVAPGDWSWFHSFFQTGVNLEAVLAAFPQADVHLTDAVNKCRGLRLLRQEPWECLASFILSSTKQIVQIRQIVRLLRERFGSPVVVPRGHAPEFAFPTASQLAVVSEADLRSCKMGFRAPYLLVAARRVAAGEIDLIAIKQMELRRARQELLRFDGVGEKIADCVLLFAYGFPAAFPVDVWVRRVLVDCYFRGRSVQAPRLRRFIGKHFGAEAGYAQQYLFHYIRTGGGKSLSPTRRASSFLA